MTFVHKSKRFTVIGGYIKYVSVYIYMYTRVVVVVVCVHP